MSTAKKIPGAARTARKMPRTVHYCTVGELEDALRAYKREDRVALRSREEMPIVMVAGFKLTAIVGAARSVIVLEPIANGVVR